MHPMLNIAIRVARAAGNLMCRHLNQLDQLKVEQKHKDDLVTQADREVEALVRSQLLRAFPQHRVMGEESGTTGTAESEYLWCVDPIDGTTNFVQGIGHFAVSIALPRHGVPELGVVFDPLLDEMFAAARGNGATLNGQRIRVANRASLDGAVIGTAFPVRYRERMDPYMQLFRRLIDNCADVRRMGAASLDLCYVACGRFDGYLEQGLKPWDFAAGELIVREAGGLLSDFGGSAAYMQNGNLVAGNARILPELLQKVCLPDTLDARLR